MVKDYETEEVEYTTEELEAEKAKYEEMIPEMEEMVQLAESIERLESENDDWRIVMNHFLIKEKDRIANVLTSSAPINSETEESLVKKLSAIRHFRMFCSDALTEAFHINENIGSYRDRLEEIDSTLIK